jgi:hypothetical protein
MEVPQQVWLCSYKRVQRHWSRFVQAALFTVAVHSNLFPDLSHTRYVPQSPSRCSLPGLTSTPFDNCRDNPVRLKAEACATVGFLLLFSATHSHSVTSSILVSVAGGIDESLFKVSFSWMSWPIQLTIPQGSKMRVDNWAPTISFAIRFLHSYPSLRYWLTNTIHPDSASFGPGQARK